MNNCYELSTYIGKVYFSNCGVMPESDTEYYEDWEDILSDKEYPYFTKAELFWKIYDWLILPSRENFAEAYPEGDIGSLRLFRIEELENVLTCYFHIDALDELSVDIKLNTCNGLKEAVESAADAIKDAVIDDDEIRSFICTDFSSERDIPYGKTDIEIRMTDEVFYRSWMEE